MEAEADENLRLGQYETFDSMEELIESLQTQSSAELQAAMDELESGGGHRSETIEELFQWLEIDEDEG